MDELIEAYGKLEHRILRLTTRLNGEYCRACEGGCCRLDICEESEQSLFLSRVRRYFNEPLHISSTLGWKESNGCALQTGRPPVCYEFYCDELLEQQSSPLERWILEVTGRLLTFAGEKALPGLHLVEIERSEDLNRIQTRQLLKQVRRAAQALDALEQFAETRRFPPGALDLLNTVLPMPEEL
jgi:hypothetical protein